MIGVRVQCKKCPWKKSTDPYEIPNGYDPEKHRRLQSTIAEPGLGSLLHRRAMACHESPEGAEQPCVGWLANQLGPGNNLAVRIMSARGEFGEVKTVGPQHETLDETLPTGTRG